jgi:hypothetical protein
MLRVERSANGPSHLQPSLLPSFHKKTLAGFSGYCAGSIAVARFGGERPLQESRRPATNWLRASHPFCLFYTRNTRVVPL